MLHRWALVCLVLCVCLPAFGGEGQPASYRVELLGEVDAAAFPAVTVRFRIVDEQGKPATVLPRADIVVLEDGREVARIRPARLRELPVALALALDTSGSMDRDEKMPEAKAAAERFFERLAPTAPCGLVLFHHQPYRRESPGLDRDRLKKLVRQAVPRGGTAYLDAVLVALEQLPATEGDHQHAVVVMTDGRDVNSEHSLRQVIEEARRRKTPVYTVGLGQPGKGGAVRTVLVLDRSGSMADDDRIESLRQAASRFVQLMPSEAADTAILAFNERLKYAMEARSFSSDKRRLQSAIQTLRPDGETHLYDAIYEGLSALAASRDERGADDRPRRMAVVCLTDGMDNRSTQYRYDLDVIPHAKRLGIPVYMLGLGPKTDINEPVMREIASSTGGQYYYIRDGAKLTEVFEELSINLHDGGIDEASLRALAKETGGEYYPVAQADRLQATFEQLALKVQNTYAVTFQSLRGQPDGTGRSVQVKLGELAAVVAGYKTHGLITPSSEPNLYVALLGVILLLLALPALVLRRRGVEPA